MHALRFVPNFGRQFRALAKFDRQEQARWVRLQLIAAPRATTTIERINAGASASKRSSADSRWSAVAEDEAPRESAGCSRLAGGLQPGAAVQSRGPAVSTRPRQSCVAVGVVGYDRDHEPVGSPTFGEKKCAGHL